MVASYGGRCSIEGTLKDISKDTWERRRQEYVMRGGRGDQKGGGNDKVVEGYGSAASDMGNAQVSIVTRDKMTQERYDGTNTGDAQAGR